VSAPAPLPTVTATLPTFFGAVVLAWDDAGLISVRLTADTTQEPSLLPRSGAGRLTAASGRVLERLTRWVRDWEAKRFRPVDFPVHLEHLPTFTRAVLLAAGRIPAGEVRTYGQLADAVGRPKGSRAVGQVMSRNPMPLVFPCHRVVTARDLGGFGPGADLKETLLAHEGAPIPRRPYPKP